MSYQSEVVYTEQYSLNLSVMEQHKDTQLDGLHQSRVHFNRAQSSFDQRMTDNPLAS